MSEISSFKQIPQTEVELEKWMKENCLNFNSYSINGNTISEGFGIDRCDGLFAWYYTERGERNYLKYFQSECEIVGYACIGFTTGEVEKVEIANILNEMNWNFI